jgi:hypothetical protein
MISVNTVIGTFDDITSTEQEILIPNASKIVFSIDGNSLDISINDNQHYMTYTNLDGIVEFCSDPVSSVYTNSLCISKIYVRTCIARGFTQGGQMRVWALK